MSDADNNNEKKFIGYLEQATEKLGLNKEDLKNELSDLIKKNTEYDIKQSKEIFENISKTIDLIQDNFEDLQKAKGRGQTRTQWLKDKLNDVITTYKPENTDAFINEIKNSLADSNGKIGVEIFGHEIDISKPLTSPVFEDLNQTAIVKNLQEDLKNNTLLGAIVFEKGNIKIDSTHKEIQAVKDYFNQKLDSPTDKDFKKAVSAATIIAQEKNLLPKQLMNKSPDEISFIVDKGVTAAKVAFKIGNGELSPIDAVEYTIDRNVSILNSAITKTCTKYGGVIGGKVGAAVGSIFGPAGTVGGAAIGTVVGKVGGYLVGKGISKGVKKIADVAKSVCSRAWEGTKSAVSSFCSGVKSLFSWW
jgi:hypothetical protein